MKDPFLETTPIENELEALTEFEQPMYLLKQGLSSLGTILLIGSGFLVNWILAIALLWVGVSASWKYPIGLATFFVIFPLVYIGFAIYYGRGLVAWQAYQQIIRPTLAKVFAMLLDRFLGKNTEETSPMSEEEMVALVEEHKNQFLQKLPSFLQPYIKPFFIVNDIIAVVRAQQTSGQGKEIVKAKAVTTLMESLDARAAAHIEPSYRPAFIIMGINLIAVFWLF